MKILDYPDFKVLKYSPVITEVQIVDHWAIEVGTVEAAYTMSVKDEPVSVSDKGVRVLKRQSDGSWKYGSLTVQRASGNAKRPFGGPKYVLQYLGRYTHRAAISNHGLVSLAEGKVTFRWRDSAHNNQQKFMTLSVDEFLRRFLLHSLPKSFVRIRKLRFPSQPATRHSPPLCFPLLGAPPEAQAGQDVSSSSDLWRCPRCGGPMVVAERFTAAEIQLRSPPQVMVAA